MLSRNHSLGEGFARAKAAVETAKRQSRGRSVEVALALIILGSCALGHLIVGKQTFPTAGVSLLPVPYVDSAVQIGDVWANVVLTLGDVAPPLLAGKGRPCTYRATGVRYQDKWLLTYPTYFNIPQACCATSNQRSSSEHWVPKPRSLRTVSVPLSSLGKVGYKNPSDQRKVDYGSQSGVPEAPGLLTQTVGGGGWSLGICIFNKHVRGGLCTPQVESCCPC